MQQVSAGIYLVPVYLWQLLLVLPTEDTRVASVSEKFIFCEFLHTHIHTRACTHMYVLKEMFINSGPFLSLK